MKLKSLYITIYIIFITTSAFAQYHLPLFPGSPKVISYNKNIYNASTQNWWIAEDNRHFIYFANTTGLLIFNGSQWNKMALPNINVVRSLITDKNGRVFIGGVNNFGYVGADSSGNFKFISLNDQLNKIDKDFGDIWRMEHISPDTFAFYNNRNLFFFDAKNLKIYKKTPLPKHFAWTLAVAFDSIYLITTDETLYVYNAHKNSFHPSLITTKLHITPVEARHCFKNKLFLFANHTMYLLDKNLNIIKQAKTSFPDYIYSSAGTDNYLFLNPFNRGLFIIDSNLNIIYHFNHLIGVQSNNYRYIFYDSFKNLWLASDNGIDYVILNSPVSYFDSRDSLSKIFNSFWLNNKLYAIEPHDIKYFTLNQILSPYRPQRSFFLNNSDGQSWETLVFDTVAFIGHNTNIIRLGKNNQVSYIRVNDQNVWYLVKYPNSNLILIATENGLYTARYNNGTLVNISHIKNSDGDIRYIAIDSDGTIWLDNIQEHAFLAKAKLDTAQKSLIIIQKYTKNNGIDDPYDAQPFIDPATHNIYVNDGKTVKIYNPKTDSFEPFNQLLKFFPKKPKTEIYIAGFDFKNNMWVNYVDYSQVPGLKYRIFIVSHKNNKLYPHKYLTNSLIFRDYSLNIKNLFNRYVILHTTFGLVFFDYNYPFDLNSLKFKTYLSKITISSNDSVIWNGNSISYNGSLISVPPQNLEIPYKYNGLTFYATAAFYENPNLTQYSFKLEGIDNKWSAWSTNNFKEYPYLREGHYTLKIRAKNIYGIISPVYSYSFRIMPPWYRTAQAYVAYLIIFVLGFYGLLRLHTYNLRRKNEKLEQIIKERTKEIKMKNAELEQQKEEILTQAEELAAINRELEKLSLIVQKTENAIILTDKDGNFVWVNPAFTKIFGYTLEELITEKSPNIIGEETDPEVKEQILKCINQKTTVKYEAQYKTKDGKPIWVQTTLTPILDEFDQITGLIAIDSDITKLKEAEQRIKQQNESIKGSIRYAQIIQQSILPTPQELNDLMETAILFKPRNIVSGDFFWLSKIFSDPSPKICTSSHPHFKPGNYFFFATVDCTGHGVPGAFMSIFGNRMLDHIINQQKIHSPAQILEQMDKKLKDIFHNVDESYRDGMVVSLCKFHKICSGTGTPQLMVTFSGAKQSIFVYKHKTNQLITYKGSRRPIGRSPMIPTPFEEISFQLEKNDVIIFFTDGYKDQNNVERRKFGTTRFKELILQNINLPLKQFNQVLEQTLNNWMKGTEQRDDITVISFRINEI